MSDAESKKAATRKDAALKFTMPVDLAGCKALIEQLACTVDSQTGTIEQLHRDKEELKLALVELLQRAFRRRSERYINNPNQLRLDFKGTDDAAEIIRMIEKLSGGKIRADSGISIKPISVTGTRRIVRFAFEYARKNNWNCLNPLESGSSFQQKWKNVTRKEDRVSIPSNRGVLSNKGGD